MARQRKAKEAKVKVKMRNSVGELVAGEEYALDAETADRYIILGYAEGELSREISDDERAELQARQQDVSL